jgi:hypothetical protein
MQAVTLNAFESQVVVTESPCNIEIDHNHYFSHVSQGNDLIRVTWTFSTRKTDQHPITCEMSLLVKFGQIFAPTPTTFYRIVKRDDTNNDDALVYLEKIEQTQNN